jgi:anti-anti-sigma factor
MDNLVIEEAQGQSGAHIWILKGALTLKELFDFQNQIRKNESNKWILDLSGVPYMDSAALGAILGAYASCERSGRGFAVAAVSPRVLTMFEVAGVDKLLPRFDSVEAAEKHLAAKA